VDAMNQKQSYWLGLILNKTTRYYWVGLVCHLLALVCIGLFFASFLWHFYIPTFFIAGAGIALILLATTFYILNISQASKK